LLVRYLFRPSFPTADLPTAAFTFFLLGAAWLGLSSVQVPQVNDKILHFATFFILTVTFYWILDTTRRRTLNLTLLVVTAGLSIGSEALQGFLRNGRQFDPLDIAANIAGSLLALGLCTLYHNRMLERRRRARYGIVPQDAEDGDLEMGGQEVGVTGDDGGEGSTDGDGRLTPTSSGADDGTDGKK
jgi:VanZ family protein